MNSAIIFGAAGQDGSFLTELLLEKGYSVAAVVRHSSKLHPIRLDVVKDNPNLEIIVAQPDSEIIFSAPLKILYPLPYPDVPPKRLER